MIRFCKLSEEMKKTQQANTAIMKCLECSCGYGYLWVRMFLILSILRDSIRRPEGCLRSFSLPIKILHPKSVIHVPTRETISVLYLLRNVSDLWPDLHNEIIKMSAFIWQNRITKNEKNAIDKFTKAWQNGILTVGSLVTCSSAAPISKMPHSSWTEPGSNQTHSCRPSWGDQGDT